MKTDREKFVKIASKNVLQCFAEFIADDLIKEGAVIPVRCKDCKMFVENKEAFVTYCRRNLNNLDVRPDDFCSGGERKEEWLD